MSSDIAVKVENLSKCFHIYDRPRDRLLQMFARGRKQYYREFWALKDVSFEIKKGETVGIIGRNGSGKSTLLQIICGTLSPTSGTVEIQGRVAALLELGSGFNPEFTGRENVYMNAAVLGLSKEEVNLRFDEIEAFADIGEFIEQPVKTYSSGMMVRLAFSVAVHVKPDILIVDEALAVGDIVFQMKCLDKMEEIRSRGTTILFVSHSQEQVKRFCTSAVWLEHGVVQQIGESNYVSDQYRDRSMRASATVNARQPGDHAAHASDAPALLKSVEVSSAEMAPFDPLTVRVTYFIGERPLPKLLLGVAIRNASGTYIFGPNTHLDRIDIPHLPGTHTVEYVIPRLPLLSGGYVFDVGLFTDGGMVCVDYLNSAAEVTVVSDYFSEGLVYIEHEWRTVSHE